MAKVTTCVAQRATFAERIAIRRELVLLVVERLPGRTAREIGAEVPGGWGSTMNDLKIHERAGRVHRLSVSAREVVWFKSSERDPLLWEGDNA